MASDDDNGSFFSRWSRRKVQVRSGEPVAPEAAPVPVPAARVAAPVALDAPASAPAATETQTEVQGETQAEAPPVLTLDDVARLTPQSDYSAFVARDVPANVRNAAVKKLFTDPHYNVMDGLDIYIDDYSKPSPLSAAELASMVGARFLKLVDDPDEAKAPAAAAGSASPNHTPTQQQAETAEQQAAPDAAGDPLAGDSPVSDTPEHPHDDHADLQLQRDDVPEPPGSGRRAG